MRFERTSLDGAWVIDLDRMPDERGAFARTYCDTEFAAHGLPTQFPQCNMSENTRAGTLRGMHFNITAFAESKFLRCVRGAIYDVIVDLRRASPTYGKWIGIELSAENGRALFVPEGFAHGFLTLRDGTDVYYHMGAAFQPHAARGFRWNDPEFQIEWPSQPTVMSERDATYLDFVPTLLEG